MPRVSLPEGLLHVEVPGGRWHWQAYVTTGSRRLYFALRQGHCNPPIVLRQIPPRSNAGLSICCANSEITALSVGYSLDLVRGWGRKGLSYSNEKKRTNYLSLSSEYRKKMYDLNAG